VSKRRRGFMKSRTLTGILVLVIVGLIMIVSAIAEFIPTRVAFLAREIHGLGIIKWRFATEGWVYSSPAIGNDGTIYIVSTGQRLYIISGTGKGLANAPWPMFHRDLRHTGRIVETSRD